MNSKNNPANTRRDFLRTSLGIGSAVLAASTGVFGEIASAPAPGEKAIPTFCAMCGPSLGCGIYAIVKDGKFVRIEGMKESPLNRGRNCPKAHAAPQWVYSPQRLKYPMVRTGKRGDGKFERVSWDKALNIIADKLKEQKAKYGPESLGILSRAQNLQQLPVPVPGCSR